MRLIILPQALAKTIPPLGNTVLNLIKNSSIVATVSSWTSKSNVFGPRVTVYSPYTDCGAAAYHVGAGPAARFHLYAPASPAGGPVAEW